LAGGVWKLYANARGKWEIQRQPLLVQNKQQADPLLSMHNYTPLVISGNDKKQLTLLSQCKLAYEYSSLEIIARSLESLVAKIELCLEVPMVANYFVLEEFKDVIVRRLLQSQLKIKWKMRKNQQHELSLKGTLQQE
jgi:hypothetical protein